jgi:hypothetical protein
VGVPGAAADCGEGIGRLRRVVHSAPAPLLLGWAALRRGWARTRDALNQVSIAAQGVHRAVRHPLAALHPAGRQRLQELQGLQLRGPRPRLPQVSRGARPPPPRRRRGLSRAARSSRAAPLGSHRAGRLCPLFFGRRCYASSTSGDGTQTRQRTGTPPPARPRPSLRQSRRVQPRDCVPPFTHALRAARPFTHALRAARPRQVHACACGGHRSPLARLVHVEAGPLPPGAGRAHLVPPRARAAGKSAPPQSTRVTHGPARPVHLWPARF